jgi:hypothetical protein
MKMIKISEAVWDAIAAKGHFGETEDDVLRRVLGVNANSEGPSGRSYEWKERRATDMLRQRVDGKRLFLEFASGAKREWTLPARDDKASIRRLRDDAVDWAKRNGATEGQQAAVMRALTHNGFHVS